MSLRDRWVLVGLSLCMLATSACSRGDAERMGRAGAEVLDATMVAVSCRIDRVKCNDDCGDGLIGKVCQDVCTISYHECMD